MAFMCYTWAEPLDIIITYPNEETKTIKVELENGSIPKSYANEHFKDAVSIVLTEGLEKLEGYEFLDCTSLREVTVHRYFYDSHAQLEAHLNAFINAYNFAKRLKSIKGLTPWNFILNQWSLHPKLFNVNPNHYTMGPCV